MCVCVCVFAVQNSNTVSSSRTRGLLHSVFLFLSLSLFPQIEHTRKPRQQGDPVLPTTTPPSTPHTHTHTLCQNLWIGPGARFSKGKKKHILDVFFLSSHIIMCVSADAETQHCSTDTQGCKTGKTEVKKNEEHYLLYFLSALCRLASLKWWLTMYKKTQLYILHHFLKFGPCPTWNHWWFGFHELLFSVYDINYSSDCWRNVKVDNPCLLVWSNGYNHPPSSQRFFL